jgi:hypothetical protein
MGRWIRVILGPLPATLLLIPILFAAGLGTALALVVELIDPGRSLADRWFALRTTGRLLVWIAAAGAGVSALWAIVLAESSDTVSRPAARLWLAAALVAGLIAASRWLWVMAASSRHYDSHTWMLWLALLGGPIVLSVYDLVRLAVRR